MSAIVVCLDCPYYQNGGWCRAKNRSVSALAPACGKAKAATQPDPVVTPEPVAEPEPKQEPEQPETFRCSICGELLPRDSFSKNKRNKNGVHHICKTCLRAVSRKGAESRAEKWRSLQMAQPEPQPEPQPKPKPDAMPNTDKELVEILRSHGWEVTCTRTIIETL